MTTILFAWTTYRVSLLSRDLSDFPTGYKVVPFWPQSYSHLPAKQDKRENISVLSRRENSDEFVSFCKVQRDITYFITTV